MNNESLLETLLSYRSWGLPVFPMSVFWDEKEKKNVKRPVVKWQKYQTELPTVEEITEWSDKYTAWGMVTGEISRIVVVDVDTNKLEDAEAVLGCDLTSNMMVKTISGGTHIYYKWSEELRNTVKLEGAPIDFRGDGGLVVIPPTKTATGEYKWFHEPSDMSRALLPELPAQVKALLTINHTKVKVNITEKGDGTIFRDGERNAASVVAIRKLLGEVPQSLWLSTGWYAFNYWCKTFCEPELDNFQIKATFDWWVRANAKGSATQIQPKSTMEVGLERIEEREYESNAPKTGYDKMDYLVKGWIPGHLYVLTAETNVGKTQAASNFAYRVAIQKKKVTYFALEPDAGIIEYFAGIHHKKRWADITKEDLKIDIKGLSIFTKESHPKLNDLLNTIEKMDRQDLIIVDHIGYFTNNADDRRSKTDQESEAIKRIVGAAKKKKTAILIIAHPRKPQGSGRNKILTMNEISGSAAFKQDATDIMILSRETEVGDKFGMEKVADGIIKFPKVKTGRSGAIGVYFVPDSPLMLSEEEQASQQLLNFI